MATYQFNKHVDNETYQHWRAYLESKDSHAILLPDYIDVLKDKDTEDFVIESE